MALTRTPGNWQSELDSLVKTSQENGATNRFKLLQTDADRVKFIYDTKLLSKIGWLSDYFTSLCWDRRRKDCKTATQHKQDGNKLFLAGRDKQAVWAYTQSVQFSPNERENDKSGTDLGLAYGNRSAVLFRLHKYQECLADIERALASGFPDESKDKLLVRQCLCHARLGHEGKAVKAQDEIKSKLQSCDGKAAERLQRDVIKISTEIELMTSRSGLGSAPETHVSVEPNVSHGLSSVLVQASSAVDMETSPSQGRFLKANRAIRAGDTLIVERPFAAVLLPPHYGTHCLHCFVTLPNNPVGCRQCSAVLFCSESCRDASWDTYHRIECCYTDLLHSVGIAHLSLRIVLTAGLSFLTDFLEKRGGGDAGEVPGVTREGRYERNYLSVYDLMTHTSSMMADDLLQYSLTASVLLGILLHSGWFDSSSVPDTDAPSSPSQRAASVTAFLHGEPFHDENSEDRTGLDMTRVFTVGGILLRHVQQLVCNAHAITALHATQVSEDHSMESQSQVRVATAIYPTASLMNHACLPTIISSFQKDTLIVKSAMDVPPGGEIFNCYGPHCQRMKRQERQTQLKTQYFFDCRCPACTADDDAYTTEGLLCPKCGQPFALTRQEPSCPSCQSSIDLPAILSELQTADADFSQGVKLLEQGDHTKALSRFRSCLRVRTRVLSTHSQDVGQAHDAIAQCLATTGRFNQACEHLTHSLAVTEATYGASGIEMGRELHKMAEVQAQAGRAEEALLSASRALDLAQKLYSPSHDWVAELLALKTALTRMISEGNK